jgi:hypothetical protein
MKKSCFPQVACFPLASDQPLKFLSHRRKDIGPGAGVILAEILAVCNLDTFKSEKTRARLAREYGVGEATVQRNGDFAAAVDKARRMKSPRRAPPGAALFLRPLLDGLLWPVPPGLCRQVPRVMIRAMDAASPRRDD